MRTTMLGVGSHLYETWLWRRRYVLTIMYVMSKKGDHAWGPRHRRLCCHGGTGHNGSYSSVQFSSVHSNYNWHCPPATVSNMFLETAKATPLGRCLNVTGARGRIGHTNSDSGYTTQDMTLGIRRQRDTWCRY